MEPVAKMMPDDAAQGRPVHAEQPLAFFERLARQRIAEIERTIDRPRDAADLERRIEERRERGRRQVLRWCVWWAVGQFVGCSLIFLYGHDWSSLTRTGWRIATTAWMIDAAVAALALAAVIRDGSVLRPITIVFGTLPWLLHLLWLVAWLIDR